MYSSCLHCTRDLGHNESIEHFPISHRVAFDAEQGRLWAICHHCERWNLAPFESRWEAVEECERAYRGTRVRVSTDNIGFARLRDGTELVRVGRPLRPEFAAWRYGDQFGRRRTRAIVMGMGAVGAAGLGVAGLVYAGVGLLGFGLIAHVGTTIATAAAASRVNETMFNPLDGGWFRPAGTPRLMKRDDVEEGWGISIGYIETSAKPLPPSTFGARNQPMELGSLQIRGNQSTHILRRVLPRVNRGGASRSTVQEGVQLIEQAGDPANFGRWAATQRAAWSARQTLGDSGDFNYIPAPARLAFEMALFEHEERRAMAGELARLEKAWRNAEEVAKIADSLHVPPMVQEKLKELKRSGNRRV